MYAYVWCIGCIWVGCWWKGRKTARWSAIGAQSHEKGPRGVERYTLLHSPTEYNRIHVYASHSNWNTILMWRITRHAIRLHTPNRSRINLPLSHHSTMASSSTDRPYPTLAEIHQRFGKPLTPTSSGSSSSSSSSPPIHQRHLDDTIISSQTRASIASRTPPRGRSSVLVGLFTHPRTGLIHVVLTQRAADLRSHAGDVALP